jgi:hypothetical protein
MKKFIHYILILILLSLSVKSFGQFYGNEWINYNQQYFKISIVTDGVYRIDSATLSNAGINMSALNPKNIQLFGRGAQQPIYIKGESDSKFNSGDFIEFYAERNDGWFDSTLYKGAANQPNPYYSQFNDTATYFLTINLNSVNNLRFTLENDVSFSSYSVAPYFYKISYDYYDDTYFFGEPDANGVTDPEYMEDEGWFDGGFSLGGSINKTIPTKNAYSGGPNAAIEFRLIGGSNYALSSPDHHLYLQFAGLTVDTTLEGYYSKKFNYSVSPSALSTTNTIFSFTSINDIGSGADRNTVSYINIKYPHTLNLENDSVFTLYVPNASGQSKTYLNLSSFNSSDSVRFYDLTNKKRIKVAKNITNYQVLVPNGSGEKKCYITSDSRIKYVTSLRAVNYDAANFGKFNNLTASQYKSSDYLIVTSTLLWPEANAYKEYRNSTGYEALVLDASELYDQFGYGVNKSPLGIRNYIRYAYENYYYLNDPTHEKKGLFFVGKSYRPGESYAPASYRKSAYYYSKSLVPGFGNPPSDNLYSNGLTGEPYTPAIPTGRLAARNGTHVTWYLNKVIEYEQEQALGPQKWMKNVLHFGGGADLSQQQWLASYLNDYKAIIEDTFFGGYVRTFLKSSTAPIQINQSDSLKDIINNGVSLMTFFGHGAGIGFDQSIDDPSAYNNKKKYPFLLANSCLAGDLYNDVSGSSEAFVLIQDKGTIGYLASVSRSSQNALYPYSLFFYKNIGYLNYGKPVGKCIIQTIDTIQKLYPNSFSFKSVVLEMTLHGDPAIKINSQEKPDYVITTPDIYFSPTLVTTENDSFTVNLISTNIGRAIDTSFVVQIRRTFPDGSFMDTAKTVPATLYKDTISFRFPLDIVRGVGLNTFTVTLDYFSYIQEYSETNNTASATLLIRSGEIVPVFPHKYAVVPALSNLQLKASTGDPFAPATDYIFQLDTTDKFNSPALTQQIVNHAGGVVPWSPVYPITSDSIVYFWRVSKVPAVGDTNTWRQSSFQYITGKRGWGQAHFFQFKNDEYQFVKYLNDQRKFVFVNDKKSLVAQTGYFKGDWWYLWTEEWVKLNGNLLTYWNCVYLSSGMKFIVFDSISGLPWISPASPSGNPYYPYGSYHCESYATQFFDFYVDASTNTQDSIAKFINNVPSGDYILMMSHRNHFCQEWDSAMVGAFRSFGSSVDYPSGSRKQDGTPYIIFGKKGVSPGGAQEVSGSANGELIQLSDTIITNWDAGYIKSELIGPATRWDSVHWRVKTYDPINTDTVHLDIIAIKADGTETPIITNLPPDSMDIFIRNRVNAAIYPYLKLQVVMNDNTYKTPALLKRWQVIYEGVPETALDPSISFSFYKDSLLEGENLKLSIAAHNIGEYDMDSLLIRYWVIDKDRNPHPYVYHRKEIHPVGDTLIDTLNYSTIGFTGLNQLWIELNPDNDQPEQYHFNNIGDLYFYVDADRINPLLDVTFDGVHILNGDIVSSKPEIQIKLKDENKFLALNDTSAFKVFMKTPGNSDEKLIPFKSSTGEDIMTFIPAVLPSNSCKILFNGDFPVDGEYSLRVQAKDVSKNKSGEYDYQTTFEVINKSTITGVMNWPNPFSTATHFVFTLTGSEIPTYFKIQIMTITGKVVREIGLDELGSIHIGRNITEYAWDGKDEYGDQLANGVYLYRVTTNIMGKTIDKMQSGADQYLTKEFGKMYLIR